MTGIDTEAGPTDGRASDNRRLRPLMAILAPSCRLARRRAATRNGKHSHMEVGERMLRDRASRGVSRAPRICSIAMLTIQRSVSEQLGGAQSRILQNTRTASRSLAASAACASVRSYWNRWSRRSPLMGGASCDSTRWPQTMRCAGYYERRGFRPLGNSHIVRRHLHRSPLRTALAQ